jgi:hypothetical protein
MIDEKLSEKETDLTIHSLHVNYVLQILNSAKRFETVTTFDEHRRPVQRKPLRNVPSYTWTAEKAVQEPRMVPDIIGRRHHPPAPPLSVSFRNACRLHGIFRSASAMPITDPAMNYAVAVEVINLSPPSQEKWEKLRAVSRDQSLLVIFNVLVDIDPAFSRSYFRPRNDGLVDCVFYMLNGRMYKNGKEKPPHYGYIDFWHEVKRLQRAKSYYGKE